MLASHFSFFFFFFNDTATTEIYTLSLHDALPISRRAPTCPPSTRRPRRGGSRSTCRSVEPRAAERASAQHSGTLTARSEEHTSELQSPCNLVCRLLLEKKKKTMVNPGPTVAMMRI